MKRYAPMEPTLEACESCWAEATVDEHDCIDLVQAPELPSIRTGPNTDRCRWVCPKCRAPDLGDVAELVEPLAERFSELMRRDLEPVEFALVVEMNAANCHDPQVCHSHDFIDANMTMEEAFLDVTGLPGVDVSSDEHTALWSRAWDVAKRSGFQFKQGEHDDAA